LNGPRSFVIHKAQITCDRPPRDLFASFDPRYGPILAWVYWAGNNRFSRANRIEFNLSGRLQS